jgi:hypothetical protein
VASPELELSRSSSAAAGLRWSGLLQVDGQRLERSVDQLDDGTGRPLNEDAFVLRRARLRAHGRWAWLGLDLELHADTVAGTPVLGIRHLEASAWVLDGTPWLRLGVGVFPLPFGFEVYDESNEQRLFTERTTLAEAFVPGVFDLGARLDARAGWARLAVAVVNGQPVGDRATPLADPSAGKDLAARLSAELEGPLGLRLRAASSLLWGEGLSLGTVPTKDVLIWRDVNEDGLVQQSELGALRGAAARPSEAFRRWGVGADLVAELPIGALGPLALQLGWALASNLDRGVAPEDPIALGRDQRSSGWSVALLQTLGAHARLGARLDRYVPNLDALDRQGGVLVLAPGAFLTATFTGELRAELPGGALGRLVLEYQRRDNALGRDAAGLPTRLADDVLRLRAEVAFR